MSRAEYMREYRSRNRELEIITRKASNANTAARRLGIEGRITVEDVRAVIDGAECVFCGETDDLTIDHIVSFSSGGPNERANLQPCCGPCNSKKGPAISPFRWSRWHDSCRMCGGTDRKHEGHGYCRGCYFKSPLQEV